MANNGRLYSSTMNAPLLGHNKFRFITYSWPINSNIRKSVRWVLPSSRTGLMMIGCSSLSAQDRAPLSSGWEFIVGQRRASVRQTRIKGRQGEPTSWRKTQKTFAISRRTQNRRTRNRWLNGATHRMQLSSRAAGAAKTNPVNRPNRRRRRTFKAERWKSIGGR